jgi:hypothetical protein
MTSYCVQIYIQYLQINTLAFPYWPGYHPETPILAPDTVEGQYGSRDDNQANIEMPIWVIFKKMKTFHFQRII